MGYRVVCTVLLALVLVAGCASSHKATGASTATTQPDVALQRYYARGGATRAQAVCLAASLNGGVIVATGPTPGTVCGLTGSQVAAIAARAHAYVQRHTSTPTSN